MKRVRFGVCLLAVSSLLVGCGRNAGDTPAVEAGPQAASSPWFPLRIGHRWELTGRHVTDEATAAVRRQSEVTGETTLDGIRCYQVVAKEERSDLPPGADQVYLRAVTTDGYLDLGREWVNEGKPYRWQKVPGLCILKPDETGPATWDARWKEYALSDKERDDTRGPFNKRKMSQAPDKVVVRGLQIEAVRVDERQDMRDHVLLTTTWYAKGIGPVKYRNGVDGEDKYLYDLEAPSLPER